MIKKIAILSLIIMQLNGAYKENPCELRQQIFFTGSFTKNEKTVAMIGIDQYHRHLAKQALTNDEEVMLNHFIDNQKQLTIFFPGTKQECRKSAHAALEFLRKVPASSRKYLLLSDVFALKAQKFLDDKQQNSNVSFEFCGVLLPINEPLFREVGYYKALFSLEKYPSTAQEAAFMPDLRILETLETQLARNKLFSKQFFSKKGIFQSYLAAIRARVTHLNYTHSLSDFISALNEIKPMGNQQFDDMVKSITEYIKTYKAPTSKSIVDLISENIVAKKSIKLGVQEAIRCFFDPIQYVLETRYHSILIQLKDSLPKCSNNLLVLAHHHLIQQAITFFNYHGYQYINPSEPKTVIKRSTVQTFLNKVFDRLLTDVSSAGHLTQGACKGKCHTCKHCLCGFEPFMSFKGAKFCSFNCFSRHRNNKWGMTCLGEYSKESVDKLLERVYQFFHYTSMIISPDALRDSNKFYQLDHTQLAQIFHHLMTTKADPLDLNQYFGISFETIHEFLTSFAQAKKIHRKNMLNFIRQKPLTFNNLNDWQFPRFDEQLFIANFQRRIINSIKKALPVDDNVPDLAVKRYFDELAKSILKQLGKKRIDITSVNNQEINEFIKSLPDETPQEKKEPKEIKNLEIKVQQSDESQSDEETVEEQRPVTPQLSSPNLKPRLHARMIKDTFVHLPYKITLFNVRSFLAVNSTLEDAQRLFKKCESFTFDKRISALFMIADSLEGIVVKRNQYNRPTIHCPTEQLDAMVLERLNIDHLFSRSVDQYLHSMGIIEQKDGHVQVSIPGEILIDNTQYVGFFQYCFNPKEQRCYHRCFVLSNSNLNNEEHISNTLRKALYDYLVAHHSDKQEYADIIKELERILS